MYFKSIMNRRDLDKLTLLCRKDKISQILWIVLSDFCKKIQKAIVYF